jgi:hypothetical protein
MVSACDGYLIYLLSVYRLKKTPMYVKPELDLRKPSDFDEEEEAEEEETKEEADEESEEEEAEEVKRRRRKR